MTFDKAKFDRLFAMRHKFVKYAIHQFPEFIAYHHELVDKFG